jgi:hypothetical protein
MIRDPGSGKTYSGSRAKKAPDPGSGSATLINNTSWSHVSSINGPHDAARHGVVQRVDVVAVGGQALGHGQVGEGEQAVPPAQPPATLYRPTSSAALFFES